MSDQYCQRCNRKLKSQKAIADGMGKVCKAKAAAEREQAKDAVKE